MNGLSEQLSQHPLLQAIEKALPELDRSLETPSADVLPDAAVALLRRTGVFRMALATDLGGMQTDPLVQLRAVESLAEHDASLGWYAMIGSDSGYYASFLDPRVAAEMYADDPDAITAGFVEPAGTALRTGDGYTVSGRWPFGSASKHARWLASGCRVRDGEQAGRWIVALLPRTDCTVDEDSWHALGLQGSGSFSYAAHEALVPRERTFSFDRPLSSDPLYRCPVMYRAKVPGVVLGAARGAVREFTSLLESGLEPGSGRPRRESPALQKALGQAIARTAAARSYAYDTVGDLWDTVQAGTLPGTEQRAAFRIMLAHVMDVCREVALSLFRAASGGAVHDRHPLQRRLRDMLTATQHALGNERTYEHVGAALVGLPTPEGTL
ncbi:hypothetical protein ACWGJ2_06930 [Streptomyces sp. NPDC054796]